MDNLDQELRERNKRKAELNNLILSDPALLNDPTALANKVRELNNAFDYDTYDIDSNNEVTDDIKELARTIRFNQKEKQQNELFSSYEEREFNNRVSSQVANGILTRDLEGLSDSEKADKLIQGQELTNRVKETKGYYDGVNNKEALNTTGESIKSFYTSAKASIQENIGGVANLTARATDTASRVLANQPKYTGEEFYRLLQEAEEKGDTERYNQLMEEQTSSMKQLGDEVVKDPNIAALNNTIVASAYTAADFIGLGENEEYKTMAFNKASRDLIRERINEITLEARQGNTVYLNEDGSIDRNLIATQARKEVENLTFRRDEDNKLKPRSPEEIAGENPRFDAMYRKEYSNVSAPRYESIIPTEGLKNYNEDGFLEHVMEAGDRLLDFSNVNRKKAEESRKNSQAFNTLLQSISRADQSLEEGAILSNTFGLTETTKDLYKNVVTPWATPIASVQNQAMQLPDMLGIVHPLTASAKVMAEARQNKKDIKEAVKNGMLPNDLSEEEIDYLAGRGGLSAAIGIVGDRLLLKVMRDSTKAVASIPNGIKGTPNPLKSATGSGITAHVASKMGSSYSNIAEGQINKSNTSMNPDAQMSQEERNEIIVDSSTPSVTQKGVNAGKFVVGKTVDVATNTVAKGTEFASDRWADTISAYEKGKEHIKSTVKDMVSFRENIDKTKTEESTKPEVREDLSKDIVAFESTIIEDETHFNKSREQYNKDNDTNLTPSEYREAKRESKRFRDSATGFLNRAKDAFKKAVDDTKNKYKDISKNKDSKPEDVEGMSDDILRNFEQFNYSKQEINEIASSPAVQNNPVAKENFEFIKTLYGIDDATTEKGTGFVAPMSKDFVPRTEQDRVSKEFFYGGGEKRESMGIITYIEKIREARKQKDPKTIESLVAHASKWVNTQSNRINSGKLYGKILNRANYEVSLMERVVKYGEGHLAKLNNVPVREENTNVAPTVEEIRNLNIEQPVKAPESKETAPKQEEPSNSLASVLKGRINEIRGENEATKAVNKIVPKSIEQDLNTLNQNRDNDNKVVTDSIVQDFQEGKLTEQDINVIDSALNNNHDEQALHDVVEKNIKSNSEEASNTVVADTEAKHNPNVNKFNPKDDNPVENITEITTDEVTNNIKEVFNEMGNDPNTLLKIADTVSLDTRQLPFTAMSSSKTRNSNDPRFKALESFALNFSILSNTFAPTLAKASDKLNKLVNNIRELQNLLPTLNEKDKAKAEQAITDNYLSMAKLNLDMSRIQGIKDIGGFIKAVTKELHKENSEFLKEKEVITDAFPIEFKATKKGEKFRNITSMASETAKPDSDVFSTSKGMFTFSINKAGEVLSNTRWLYDSDAFTKEGVRRLRNDTRNITQEKDDSFTDAVEALHTILSHDINNPTLNPQGADMSSSFNKNGSTASFRQSPLSMILYSISSGGVKGKNVLSDNVKANIIITALQSVKENSMDLLYRDKYSVASLLNRTSTEDVSGSEYNNFTRIGIPSSALVDRIQDSFSNMFSLKTDDSKTPANIRERMAAEAAIMAVNYLVDTGVLIEEKHSPEYLNSLLDEGMTNFNSTSPISFLRTNTVDDGFSDSYSARMSPWDKFYDFGYSFTGNEKSRRNAQPLLVTAKEVPINIQTDTYTDRVLEGTKKHANETIYEVLPYFKDLVTNEDDMMELLGYNEDVTNKVKQKIMLSGAIAGRNGEVSILKNNVSFLVNNPNMVDEGFKHPMSIYSNGRTAITSTFVNPMSDKVSRAFLSLNSYKKVRDSAFVKEDSEAHAMFLYGLAFKMGNTENATQESFDRAIDSIESMDISVVKPLVEKMKEGSATLEDFKSISQWGSKVFPETDNSLGVINAVYELVNYRGLLDGSIESYDSYMTVDNDAKNSGVAITRAIFGEKNVLGSDIDLQNLNQVGIYINGEFSSFADFSQLSGNFDAYQFVIKKGMDDQEVKLKNGSNEEKAIAKATISAMDKLSIALGSKLYTDGSIHKILREIAKPLLMTAYYEAGAKSLLKSAKNAVLENIVKRMNEIAIDTNDTRRNKNLYDFNKAFGTKFDRESITNGLDNRGMERFYDRITSEIAEPISEMAVNGVIALTESTSENRSNIIKALNQYSDSVQNLHNNINLNLRLDMKNKGQEPNEADRKIIDSFIDSSLMKIATTSGSHTEGSHGLKLGNYERASVNDLAGREIPKELAGVEYNSLNSFEKKKYDTTMENYNNARNKAVRDDILVQGGGRVTLPKQRALGKLGVGTLAKNAHAEDSGIVNDVYLGHESPVLAIYDQFTGSPEDIIKVSQIANQSFKERTLNNSVTEDFTKGASYALSNSINEYMSSERLKQLISPATFYSYVKDQTRIINQLNSISNEVDERRRTMFGNERNITIDNYPLGHIDDVVRSPSDNAPVTLFDKVAKYEAISKAFNDIVAFQETFGINEGLHTAKKNLSKVTASLKVAQDKKKSAEDILKAREGISIDKLKQWADNTTGIVATEKVLNNTLGSLAKLDGNRVDNNTLDAYTDVLTELVNPILESSKELDPTRKEASIKIDQNQQNQEAYGFYNSADNEVVVSTSFNKDSTFTNSEVFMHELVHSITYDAINNDNAFQQEVLGIFNDARKQAIKEGWNDPSNINHDIWQYVFNNPNTTKKGTNTGLLEFASYGLTNPATISLLKNTRSDYRNPTNPFQVSSGKGLFSKLIATVVNAVSSFLAPSNTRIKDDAHKSLFETVKNIDRANKEAITNVKLAKNEKFLSFRDAVTAVNKAFENLTDKSMAGVKNIVGRIKVDNPNTSTTFRVIMTLKGLKMDDKVSLLKKLDKEPAKALEITDEAFSIARSNRLFDNQGDIQTAKTSLTGGYNKASKVKNLILKSIQKSVSDSALANKSIKEVLKPFTDNLSKEEDTSMTSGIVSTGMYRLVDTIGVPAMASFILGSKQYRLNTISSIKANLQNSLPREQMVTILNQLEGMSNNMSGVGNIMPSQMTNVDNVIKGFHVDESDRAFYVENSTLLNELKPQMETLVALQAYYDSTGEVRTNVENVFSKNSNNKGEPNAHLVNAIKVMNEVRNVSIEKDFGGNTIMTSMGYTSTMKDPNLMEHYIPSDELKKYEKEGWKYVDESVDMTRRSGKRIVLVTKRIPPEIGYNDHALYSKHQRNPLEESVVIMRRLYGDDAALVDTQEVESAIAVMRKQAVNGHTNGNPYGLLPILNASGEVTGFTHNTRKNTLPLRLQKDRLFSEVVADEYARVAGDFTAKNTSMELITALKEDFDANMSKDPNGFSMVTNRSYLPNGKRNPFYESYKRLTPEVKKHINDTFGGDHFYVRTGMARAVIGTKKIDISENVVTNAIDRLLQSNDAKDDLFIGASSAFNTGVRNATQGLVNPNVDLYNNPISQKALENLKVLKSERSIKPFIRATDAIWREIVQRSKSAIAVMNPAVFAFNYASNATMLMVNGISPTQIAQYTVESFKELRKYENNMKELYKVEMGLTTNPNDRNLLARKSQLDNMLNSSLAKQMMDEGMMQSVSTDIKYEEYGYLNRGGNKVVDLLNDVNPDIELGNRSSKIFKEVFMVGDSTTGTIMSYGNQVMDYTSRYVYLKSKKENQQKVNPNRRSTHEDLVREAQDLFINYALPDSKGIEFANDMGIIWFSKYYMGIQHVVMNLMKTKPVNSLAYLLGISQIFEAEDIYKNFFAVDAPSKLFRSPMDALETLAVPPMIKAFY